MRITMTLLTCGINHHSAPLGLREKIAFPGDLARDCLNDLSASGIVGEVALLSTCNRTELYCDLATSPQRLLEWLRQKSQLLLCDLLPHIYIYRHDRAIEHLMRVACGLDSMALGESQILGQIKAAFRLAQATGTVGSTLSPVFRHVFSATKKIRSDTKLGHNHISLGFATLDIAKRIFETLTNCRVLLIGAGQTTQLIGRYLYQERVAHITVANRTLPKATELAEQFSGSAISLAQIPDHLATADIVITATASQLPLLGKGAVERALKARRHKPMLLVDLAVPRDVEPEIEQLSDVFLYTIDDLQFILQQNLQQRRYAAEEAEFIVQQETQQYLQQLKGRLADELICLYRQSVQTHKDTLLAKALHRLKSGQNAEQVLQEFAHRLTNQLMHQPCIEMKAAGCQGDDVVLSAAKRLLLTSS